MQTFDLSKWEEDYATAPAERDGSGERTEVADGKYQAKVARVELKDSKQGNAMLEWELDILGPRSAGRKIWRRNMLASADNIKWLKQDLFTCGLTLQRLNDLNDQRVLSALIGVTLQVTKKTKGDYSNVYFDKRIALGAQPAAKQGVVPAVDDDDVPF
jgi:hypothetical protein